MELGCRVFVEVLILHMTLLLLLEQVSGAKQTYIVQMTKPDLKPESYNTHNEWYTDLFRSHTSSDDDSAIIHTYEVAYNGFAVSMSPEEVESLRKSEFVLGVHPDVVYSLHTTRTPQFLGLTADSSSNGQLWDGLTLDQLNKASEDVIIGVVDTGVRPESKSFGDQGMPNYVPSRWKGKCEFNDPDTRSSNNKLIGARNFVKGSPSPLDDNGHGSHMAGIAAGSEVANVNFSGYAEGNARGVAYRARLAAYKVADESGTASGSDVLAGIEAAILEGVDVLSISMGSPIFPSNYSYALDPIAIGAFAAMEKGIFVSCSAGNDGPDEGSVGNVAPWVVTVGAGTIDRDFHAFVTLSNGTRFRGESMYVGTELRTKNISFELSYGGDGEYGHEISYCLPGRSETYNMIGKVVICDEGRNSLAEKVNVVSEADGEGIILVKRGKLGGEVLLSENNFFPLLAVGDEVGDQLKKYIASVGSPTVQLSFGGTDVINVKPSPLVAAFSSRGPNPVTAQILKPDLIGPGENIFSAWADDYMIASGTSMSCPHISGIAALIKAAHPKWTTSAIKSAMMTTAYTIDNTNSSIHDTAYGYLSVANPLAYGAGHVNPQKALSPGLVYEATADDYVDYLCSIKYTAEMIESVTRRPNTDCNGKSQLDPGNLNYPSFAVVFEQASTVVNYTRELTNVDDAGSTYKVSVEDPQGVNVDVQPSELTFSKLGDKQWYNITFTSQNYGNSYHSFGSITWTNENDRQVRSPISVSHMDT